MDIRKLQRAIVDGLEDVKAHDIVVFNTEHLSPLFERVIIASGTSNRQTKALAASVRDSVKSRGMQVMRTEGEDNGEWIIVDCGAAVAHIMQPAIRTYYHLEEIWGDKPVRMKIDHGGRPPPPPVRHFETPIDEPAPASRNAAGDGKPAARSARPAAAPSGKVAAKNAAAKAAAAKKPAARKAAAQQAAKTVLGKSPGAKRTAAKTPARKAVTRTTGTKTSTRQASAKRPAASGRR